MRRSPLVAVAIAATLTLSSGTARAATREDLAARVDEALAAVREGRDAVGDAEAADDLADEVRTLLPAGEVVEDDGRRVRVDTSVVGAIAGRLAEAPSPVARSEAVADLERHLASMSVAMGRSGAAVEPDEAVLGALLRSQVVDTRTDLNEILRRYMDRLLSAFEAWWSGLSAGGPAGQVAQWVVVGVAAAVLLWIAWVVWRAISPKVASRDRGAASADEEAPVVAAAEGLPPDALAHAEALAAQGRLRDALRALYGGAARGLVEAGVVVQTRTRTDSELLAEVEGAAPGIRRPLGELTDAFERSWYGHIDPGAVGWGFARDAYGRTMEAVSEVSR